MPPSFTFDDSLKKYSISQDGFLKTLGSQSDKLIVGIVISQNDTRGSRILVVQRAATERHYPNSYEIPGGKHFSALATHFATLRPGKVEAEDETVLHAAVRETFEETGLQVVHFVGEFQPLTYTLERRSDGKPVTYLQLNFVANTEGSQKVTVNPAEHQAYKWVAEDELEGLPSSEEMKGVIRNAFKYLDGM